MVNLTIALLIIGTILICIETFVPGFGFFGISGIILLVLSAFFTFMYIPFGPLIVIGELVLFGVGGYFAFQYIRKKQLHGKLILTDTLNIEKSEIGDLDFFMGKEGIAKTPLKPFGQGEFNGVSIDVHSDGEYIPVKKRIKVVDVSKNRVTVKEIKEQ